LSHKLLHTHYHERYPRGISTGRKVARDIFV
jgi:hypothetical protein